MDLRHPCRQEAARNASRVRPRGFTLIELMMVVGIMGIVLAMGLPAIVRTLERQPLQQAVTDITEALSHARAQAILRGRPSEMVIRGDGLVFVRLRPDPRVVGMVPDLEGSAAPSYEVGAENDETLFEATLGEDIMITAVHVNLGPNLVESADSTEARVQFFPNGTSDDFQVTLQDHTGVRRITTDPVTGFPDVEMIP